MGWKRKAARTDELLSAYLDGELSPEERTRLEARLVADPDLRARLEAMRRTVDLVRDLPQVEPPRNFLLTPEMVAPPRRRPTLLHRRLAPALSFATALSALACALVLIGNLLTFGAGKFGLAPAAAPSYEVAMEPATEEAAVESAPQPTPEEPRMAAGGVVTPTLEMTKTFAPEAAVAEEEGISPTIAIAAAPTPLPAPMAADTGEETEQGVPPSPTAPEGSVPPSGGPPPQRPGWPFLAIGLTLLTLGLLVATIQAWRTRV